MDEFHIGDQVVVTGSQDYLGAKGIGLQGTIVKNKRGRVSGKDLYGVEFPEDTSENIACHLHNLGGSLSNRRGYYFYPENIEVVKDLGEINLEDLYDLL